MAAHKKKVQEGEDDDKKKKRSDLDDDVPLTKLFLRRFVAGLKKLLPDKDVNAVMKSARSSAGGEMKKRRRSASEPMTFDDDFTPAFRPKKDKATVSYAEASVVGEQCQICRFYLGGACRLVEGTIFPDFVCDLFEEKLQIFSDNIADLCAGSRCNAELQLFNELQEFAEPPEWIPYLPKPGEYNSPKYGDIFITKERNENFIRNFEDGVYQTKLPISSEHIDADPEGAYGWIEGMRMNEDGSVDAKVLWTDRGVEAIENDRFMYFSPEFHDVYKDNKEVIHKDVAVGGALTTRPFFKEEDLGLLVATEGVLTFSEGDNKIRFMTAAHRRKEDDMKTSAKDKGGAGASKDPGKFQQFREGLAGLLKKFGDDSEGDGGQSAASSPAELAAQAAEAEKVKIAEAEKVKAAEEKVALEAKAANEKLNAAERFQALETENRTLKATEVQHAVDAKKSVDRIEALEMTEQRGRFELIAMGEGQAENRWTGKIVDHIEHMLSLKKAFGENSNEFKHYVNGQKANVVAMNTAGLFKERGSLYGLEPEEGIETPEGALAELKKKASELQVAAATTDKPLTHEQAMELAGQQNPKLKKTYREQFRSANTVAK